MITTTVNGEQKIQVYTAIMTQTSTNAPTVQILQNTIGNIVWARDTIGSYYGTLADTFKTNKRWAIIGTGSGYQDTLDATTAFYAYFAASEDYIFLNSEYKGQLTDGMITECQIEIRIYND